MNAFEFDLKFVQKQVQSERKAKRKKSRWGVPFGGRHALAGWGAGHPSRLPPEAQRWTYAERPNVNRRHVLASILVVLLVVLGYEVYPRSGAGSADEEQRPLPRVPVAGTIRLDGKPLPGAVVTFMPMDSGGTTPRARSTAGSGTRLGRDAAPPPPLAAQGRPRRRCRAPLRRPSLFHDLP